MFSPVNAHSSLPHVEGPAEQLGSHIFCFSFFIFSPLRASIALLRTAHFCCIFSAIRISPPSPPPPPLPSPLPPPPHMHVMHTPQNGKHIFDLPLSNNFERS
ncbi:hypothetical protein POVWA2_050070 [Plasmodium ovale wallikeri]|uniref:Uncharacterized protein n=1 Tax=Plasmodium ovale wallikeri TaxID=864142 RepID=A0A1A8ZNP5_PLAOA|nr:hypothetical protein POVWA2_050070 [Plasmodium ovale wallikeri]